MTELKRKKSESFESFLRRFNKSLIKSRKLQSVRKRKYFHKDKNENQVQKRALKRLATKSKVEYLKKIGKMEPETTRRW